MVELYGNKIYSKSNLFDFDLKYWISRELVVLITGVKNEITQEENETIDWIIPPLKNSYLDQEATLPDAWLLDNLIAKYLMWENVLI